MASKDTATIAQDNILLRCVEELRSLSRAHSVPIAELLEQFNLLVNGDDTRPDGLPKLSESDEARPLLEALAGAPRPVARSLLRPDAPPLTLDAGADAPGEPAPEAAIANDRYTIIELCG